MNEPMERFNDIFRESREKCRYGSLWGHFTVEELVDYARFKAKRGMLIKKDDDLMDAANVLLMAVDRMRQ